MKAKDWVLFATCLLVAFFVFSSGFSAHAQTPFCTEREEVVSGLLDQYSEVPKNLGIANNGGVIEILTSQVGSWTIILTMPNGVTCMIAAGEHWMTHPIVKIIGGPDA